jgi:hypothetical protein
MPATIYIRLTCSVKHKAYTLCKTETRKETPENMTRDCTGLFHLLFKFGASSWVRMAFNTFSEVCMYKHFPGTNRQSSHLLLMTSGAAPWKRMASTTPTSVPSLDRSGFNASLFRACASIYDHPQVLAHRLQHEMNGSTFHTLIQVRVPGNTRNIPHNHNCVCDGRHRNLWHAKEEEESKNMD